MKDLIIAAMLVLAGWLYLDNVKKETAILSCRAQIAEELKRNSDGNSDLRHQLAEAKNELQDAKRQIADLRSKIPNSKWLQDRVDQSKGALELPRTWVDSSGVTHSY